MMAKMTFRIALGLIACTAAAPGLSAMQTIEDVTCDRGACPRPLNLVNGEAVTISLTGQGLAGLASGVVTDRSGRPIEGVSVVLGEVPRTLRTRSLTTTRDVTLTARGVGALSDLQLRFTTSRRGTVTAPLDLSVAAAPTVTAAVPSSRTLTAGGPNQTVILNGSNLDRVTGAYVERNGTRIDAVFAVLQPTTDAGRREVRLGATTSAGPPWNVTLDLVLEAPPGLTARTPLQMVLRAPPDIDLTISCSFDSRSPIAYALIRNEGSETAVFQPNETIARFRRPGFVYDYKADRTTHIPPGGRKSFTGSMPNYLRDSGAVIIVEWIVNPMGHVTESHSNFYRSNYVTCKYTY